MNKFSGIIAATAAAYDQNGQLDEQGSREIIRHNLGKMRCSGLFVAGSSAEGISLSFEQKKLLLEITADEVNGKVPIIAHVGTVNLDESIALGKISRDLKYDAISSVPPFYYKVAYKNYRDWYNRLCDESEMDLIIYNIPHLTGISFTKEQFSELYLHEKIIGVKFTNADLYLMEQLKREFPHKLLFAGFDEMLLPALTLGVDGAIGTTYNFNGDRANDLYQAFKRNEMKLALKLQGECNELIEKTLDAGLFPAMKYALTLQGINAGYCRPPFPATLTESEKSDYKLKTAHLLSV